MQYNRELLRAKELSHQELKIYKENIISDSEADFCWIARNYPKLGSTFYGLGTLNQKQHQVLDLINVENDVERHRHYILNKGMQLGYRETLKSLSFEIRDVKKALKGIKKYRKYLITGRK